MMRKMDYYDTQCVRVKYSNDEFRDIKDQLQFVLKFNWLIDEIPTLINNLFMITSLYYYSENKSEKG